MLKMEIIIISIKIMDTNKTMKKRKIYKYDDPG